VRRLKWKLILPILQVIAAVCLWLYMPLQFDLQMHRRMHSAPGSGLGLSPEIIGLYRPSPVGRVLYGLNFPAYELSNRASMISHVAWIPDMRFRLGGQSALSVGYSFGIRELMFFIGVCTLWFWVGSILDELRNEAAAVIRPPHLFWRVAEIVILVSLAIFLLRRSIECLTAINCYPPERTIVTVGLVWPAIFLTYALLTLKCSLQLRKWQSNPTRQGV
jgi:hypothetical protein